MKTRILLCGYFFLFALLAVGQTGDVTTFGYQAYYSVDSLQVKESAWLTTSDSSLHGPYQSYYQNGNPKTIGFYTLHLADSIWTYYYENGHLKARGSMVEGLPTGSWTYFFENENLKASGIMKEGKTSGTWSHYYENGTIKSTGNYESDQKVGLWNYFFEDGTLKATSFYENGSGSYREFYQDGSVRLEGKIRHEKSEGSWSYYHDNGALQARGDFADGLREGVWNYYHPNGQLSATGIYQKGEKQGQWSYFHANGVKSSEGMLVKGKKEGQWNLYYESGELKGTGRYSQDNGQAREYYPSGVLHSEGLMAAGEKEGLWIYFNEIGEKEGEALFEKGVGWYRGYYVSGPLKMEGEIAHGRRTGEWVLYDEAGNVTGTYRPIYEEDHPVYRLSADRQEPEAEGYVAEKPEYRFKNRTNHYFDRVINEFHGVIIAGNPLWMVANRIPVSIEYYIQERMGFELIYTYNQRPIFVKAENAPLVKIYGTGSRFQLRQKFYSPDRPIGMFYFGHEVTTANYEHNVKIQDQMGFFEIRNYSATERTKSYGLFIGNRWMEDAGKKGFSMDTYVGVGIGKRYWEKNYTDKPQADDIFAERNQKSLFIPFNIGVNLGWAFPAKTKSKNKDGH